MHHIEVKATVTGDAITAISHCVEIAKLFGDTVYLHFPKYGYDLPVRPKSDVLDLHEIYLLKTKQLKP